MKMPSDTETVNFCHRKFFLTYGGNSGSIFGNENLMFFSTVLLRQTKTQDINYFFGYT